MRTALLLCTAALLAASTSQSRAQGMPPEAREKIHHLFDQHTKLKRTVTVTDTGYTAITESDDAATAAALKAHVKQMSARLKSGLMVRRWDPAFAEYVEHYDEMEHRYEPTDKGMKATVTGKTALGIKIARNHAQAVSDFAAHGWEAHDRRHPGVAGGKDSVSGDPRGRKSEELSVKPGINAKFLDPTLKVEEWTEKFETESREIFHQRNQILASVALKPGMKIADIGAGTGLFTLPFANAVGAEGKVYAVEISKKFVEHIRARAQKSNATNVETILCTDRSVKLPGHSIDLAFICDVYHHFEFPQASLASLHKALKPGGELILIDFKRIPGESSDFVMGHVRAGQDVFESELIAAGFEKVSEVKDVLKENYFVRFRKP